MGLDYLMDEVASDGTEVVLKQNQVHEDIIVSVKEIAKGEITYDHDTSIFTISNVNFIMDDVYAITMYLDESIELTLIGK